MKKDNEYYEGLREDLQQKILKFERIKKDEKFMGGVDLKEKQKQYREQLIDYNSNIEKIN